MIGSVKSSMEPIILVAEWKTITGKLGSAKAVKGQIRFDDGME